MIKIILTLLKSTQLNTEDVRFAKGAYKYPENWKEFINYIRTR
jgi:hypothetical protein